MNVSKEADRRFVEALKVEDPRRYDNLMKNCLRAKKLEPQAICNQELADQENAHMSLSAKKAEISGKSPLGAK